MLLLIDATAYLFRAYHAVADLRTSDGKPTGAVFGALNMLDKLLRERAAEHVGCVMDAPGKTFRHALFAGYKATRPPAPPDLLVQIDTLKAFVQARGLPLLVQAGVEADDVIATYARRAAAQNMPVLIASSDKDLMQLVQDGQITLYDGMKETLYDRAAVLAKYGVPPNLIGDYLALTGDASDNVPGVPKVGAKTAAKWLMAHGDLAGIMAAADDIKGVVGENLRAAIADGTLALSRQLVTLKDDVDLPPLDFLRPRPPDAAEWRRLCGVYEFKNLQKALEADASAAKNGGGAARPAVQIIRDEAALARWLDKIRAAKVVAIDTETTGAPAMAAALVGVSLSVDGTDAAYIPLAHVDADALMEKRAAPDQLPSARALQLLAPVLADESIVKILHNGKYDWHVLASAGAPLAGTLHDTKIAAYALNAASDSVLSQLAQRFLGVTMSEYKEVTANCADFAEVPIAAAADYAGEDAWVTRRLHDELQDEMSPAARRVYDELDRPLMPVLARIERAGMKVDAAELSRFAEAMRAEMGRLEARAHQLAGAPFNLNSPRQLEAILFDQMGAQPLRKTGGGARSTSEGTLEKLAADFPLAQTLLEYRAHAKLVGTYAEKLPQMILPATGRIHTSFNQTAVLTGRLSSSSPNLQNIPIKTEAGRRIRRAFIAEEGRCLLSADYSQIELRIMAHIAGDEALLSAFAAGADIHKQTAAEVFGAPLAEVSGEQRRAAKAINFGLIYGMSAYGLARALGVEQGRAQTYIERYFARYPQVAAFMERIRREGPKQGYVETIFGRRIPLDTLRGGAQAAERVAINAPIQGSAADVMKKAMLAADAAVRAGELPGCIVLQVHDELLLEVERADAEDARARLQDIMQNAAQLSVVLEVEAGWGESWGADDGSQ